MATKNPPPTKEQFIQHLLKRGVSEERAKRLANEAERQGLLAKAAPNPTKSIRPSRSSASVMAGPTTTRQTAKPSVEKKDVASPKTGALAVSMLAGRIIIDSVDEGYYEIISR